MPYMGIFYVYMRSRLLYYTARIVDKREEKNPGSPKRVVAGGAVRSPVLFIGRVDNMCASSRNTHARVDREHPQESRRFARIYNIIQYNIECDIFYIVTFIILYKRRTARSGI